MCGIVGYIGAKDPVEVLIEGLRRLEYRGYDSAGIAVVDGDGELHIRRAPGKLRDLEKVSGREADPRPLRHRAHALGDPRPPHRGERPPAPRLHRPDRRHPQRHHRELPRAEARAAEAGATASSRETDTEIVAHAIEQQMKDHGVATCADGLPRGAPRFRGIYALGRDLGRRPGHARRGARRPAARRRDRQGRVLRRLRHSRDPLPHQGRRLHGRLRDRRA